MTYNHVQTILDAIAKEIAEQHPDKDTSVEDIAVCDDNIIRAYKSDVRVRVENTETGSVRCGFVSRTSGWRPMLLLVHRRGDMGSWDVLGPRDRIVAVKRGRHYIEGASVH